MELIDFSALETMPVRWLWEPYIPKGKLSLVQGDPGQGKTTFCLALAAALTTGRMPPGSLAKSEPQWVIFQSAEDGLADTIRPRLEAAGADLRLVRSIDERESPLSLSDSRIEEAVAATGAGLLVIDPLQAYLGAGVDMHRANQVRPQLSHLAGVAERTGCAVVLIGHMNKASTSDNGLYRGLGSIDIAAAMRSVLLVGSVKGERDVRAAAHIKSSLAPAGKPFAFSLGGGALRWIGEYDVTVEELLGSQLSGRQAPKTERAKELLAEVLRGRGDVLSNVLYERCAAEGIGRRTVENAKAELGVVSFKVGRNFRSRWPDESDDAQEVMPL
jgi:hypothetical protein